MQLAITSSMWVLLAFLIFLVSAVAEDVISAKKK
jgi:hypothetical protein